MIKSLKNGFKNHVFIYFLNLNPERKKWRYSCFSTYLYSLKKWLAEFIHRGQNEISRFYYSLYYKSNKDLKDTVVNQVFKSLNVNSPLNFVVNLLSFKWLITWVLKIIFFFVFFDFQIFTEIKWLLSTPVLRA